MAKPLVIVESPAKAKTIGRLLGTGYVVESSMGHVRDLPRNAAEVPAAYRDEEWARDLGVDVDNDFKPLYIVTKKDQVRKLKGLLKEASELYLATDEDREGESIAWHLREELAPRVPVRRMVFHEITRAAIEQAVAQPRDLDERLVDAQETRRIFDRLFGYKVSPVLWRRIRPGLSAGRVQSVAVRLLVERERERMAFRSATWWDVEGTFARRSTPFGATLVGVDGRRVATGKDFGPDALLKARADAVLLDEAAARDLAGGLQGSAFTVRAVDEKPYRRSPSAPFMTSTLQQEASRKLGYGARRTMDLAQRLYENGYITYMRTDSTTLSETALDAARTQARQLYGPEYVPDRPRVYAKKVKNAQEAHEAIRPAGEQFRLPDQVAAEVGRDEARLYELVWKRTIASQMTDAVGRTVTVRLGATAANGRDAEFATSGTVITFPGFRRAYVEGADDPDAELAERERPLPALATGDTVDVVSLDPRGHTTSPPARYTEASLVKKLEEMGVGRPSTYASIIDTILNRDYARRKGGALVPTFTAFSVVALLERHFSTLVDYGLTASMEDDLDRIANGDEERIPWLRRFYFGNGEAGLRTLVSDDRLGEIDPAEVNTVVLGTDPEGREIVVRNGRYGPYVRRGDDTASVPEDLSPDELTVERALELLSAPSGDRVLGTDPTSGLPVLVKAGRYGPYVQLGEPDAEAGKPDTAPAGERAPARRGAGVGAAPGKQAKGSKPRTASLFKSMDPATVTLEDALRLLTLPRVVGVDSADGEEIVAMNGRYGPFLKKGDESRSLDDEEQLLTITLEEALARLAQPRTRRGQQATGPLRELGAEPGTGREVTVRSGRFGPYVTDGETNASLRVGDAVEDITIERAAELLAARRQAIAEGGGRPAKRGAKKAPAKAGGRAAGKASGATAKKASTGAEKAAKKVAKKAGGTVAKKAASPAGDGSTP